MPANILNAKGLVCPLPVLRARKAMKGMPPGEVLEIHATDPGTRLDIPHFCEAAGYELLETREEGEVLVFRIRKTA